MARYIDAEALTERLWLQFCKDCNSYNGVRCGGCDIDDTIDFIEDAPTADVVEVVRCKSCVHYHNSALLMKRIFAVRRKEGAVMATPWTSEEERNEYFRKQSVAQYFAKELKSRCVKGGVYPAFVEAMTNEILKEIEEGKFNV